MQFFIECTFASPLSEPIMIAVSSIQSFCHIDPEHPSAAGRVSPETHCFINVQDDIICVQETFEQVRGKLLQFKN